MFNNFPFHVCSEFFSENSSNGNRCENLMKIQKINEYIYLYILFQNFLYMSHDTRRVMERFFPSRVIKMEYKVIFFLLFDFLNFSQYMNQNIKDFP